MSSFDYTRTAATATRLLERFGAAGAVRRSSTTGGNAWDPSSGTTTTTDYPATMVVTDYAQADINGTVIQSTDKKVLMAPGVAVVPNTSDVLVTPDGGTLSVVGVKPLKPAATLVMYEIQARSV